MIKAHRSSLVLRYVVLALLGIASSACYFDGHFGHCHRIRFCPPVRVCR